MDWIIGIHPFIHSSITVEDAGTEQRLQSGRLRSGWSWQILIGPPLRKRNFSWILHPDSWRHLPSGMLCWIKKEAEKRKQCEGLLIILPGLLLLSIRTIYLRHPPSSDWKSCLIPRAPCVLCESRPAVLLTSHNAIGSYSWGPIWMVSMVIIYISTFYFVLLYCIRWTTVYKYIYKSMELLYIYPKR